ncbi:MAG: hypothetical protein K2X47_03615, partial [Bdellovibrionales bacterium]|nr:hypothetical protein [Bdellovibrionales bacterium]
GLFAVGTGWAIVAALPALRLAGAGHSLQFRGHLFSLVSCFLVLASLIHASIFNERWTLKSLALLALSFGLVCRAFALNDILLTGIIVGLILLLFSQAPLISNRDPSREELSLGLFFFLISIAGFALSAAFFESGLGTLILKDVLLLAEKGNQKVQLGWLFGFASSVLILVLPFFGLFQSGVHRSRSWPIYSWLLGMVGLAGVSSTLAWMDASQALFPQYPFLSKSLCLLVGIILSTLAMIQGCFSRKVSAVFQTWTMTPLVSGFVAYALGTPEGEILSAISFCMWIFGLVAVGGTLNLLAVETEFTLEQLSGRLLEAERFSRGLFLFSLGVLSPLGSLVCIKAVTLTLGSDTLWIQGFLGPSGVWAFPLMFLFLVSGMVAAFVVPLMRVYPIASTQSNSSSVFRPLTWDQVKVALLLVPVIVVGIYTTHLYKYMAKTFMP